MHDPNKSSVSKFRARDRFLKYSIGKNTGTCQSKSKNNIWVPVSDHPTPAQGIT